MKLGCVVLASGEGKRFREHDASGNKLLAPVAGAPLIVKTVCGIPSELFEVVVATRLDEIARELARVGCPVRVALHSSPMRSDSIRAGLAQGAERWDGVLFIPGDQPLVSRESFLALADAFEANPSRVYRLSWNGEPASPVLFPASLFPALMRLQGRDGGASLLRSGIVDVAFVEARRACELLDVDVPADIERIEACCASH